MVSERLTRERRRELTREALLDAAVEAFARRGYEAASLEEIADRAGFTKGAIYSNFGDRESLFLAVLERRNGRLLDAYERLLREAHEHRASPAELARVWAEQELADRESLVLTLEIRLAALRNETVRRIVGEFERQTEETVARFVADRLADADAALSVPVKEFAAIVYAANQGLWQHAALCSSDHTGIFETLLRLLVGGTSASERRTAPAAT